ncbi:MAG: hypothetical protein ACREVN_05505 [Gammaproteobacteria bacterium]
MLQYRLVAIAALAITLAGCITTEVPVTGEFPAIVMRPLPYVVGVHYPDELKAYTHEEKLLTGRTWVVELGAIHVSFFDGVLAGIFTQLVRVEELPTAGSPVRNVDGIIQPRIEDFQFATPDQTQSEFYEVWIRYRMSLYSPAGKLVERWPLSAYGKSRSQFAQAKDSINDATIVAMRDAAALLAVKFKTEPDVPEWFAAQEEKRTPVNYTGAGTEADRDSAGPRRAAGDDQPGAR